MKTRILALGGAVAALSFGAQAHASVWTFQFNDGNGISGQGYLTVAPNVSPPDPNPDCGTAGNNPCRADPVGAYTITGISGTFTDTAAGVTGAAITGMVPISPTNERDAAFDPLVPASLSYDDYAPGTGAFTYNNLFFPGGSPIDCDFPGSGTFVDVFGMAFNVTGGYTVDLWGDGNAFGPLTYGVEVVNGTQLLANEFNGVNASATPEPVTWAMLLMGFGALGGAMRRRRGAAVLAV
jgi:hypothetical protein